MVKKNNPTLDDVFTPDNQARDMNKRINENKLITNLASRIDGLSENIQQNMLKKEIDQNNFKPIKNNLSDLLLIKKPTNDNLPATEETQQFVLKQIANTAQWIKSLFSPVSMLNSGIELVSSILSNMNQTLVKSLVVDQGVIDSIKEQSEIFKSQLLRSSVNDGDGEVSNDKIIKSLDGIQQYVENEVNESLKENVKSGKKGIKGISGLFGFLGGIGANLNKLTGGVFTKIFSLFSKRLFLLTGVFGIAVSTFNYLPKFEKTTKALSDIFTGNGNIMDNIKNLFSAIFKDLGEMFTPTKKMVELGGELKKLWNDNIIPTFKYIVDEIFWPFVYTMKDVFVKDISPRLEKFISWLQGDGGKDLSNGIKTVVDGIFDVLIFITKNIIPPLIDISTSIAKVLVPIVKFIFPFIRDTIFTILDLLSSVLKNSAEGITNSIEAFKKIFSGNIIEGVSDLFSSIFSGVLKMIDDIGTFIVNIVSDFSKNLFGFDIMQAIGMGEDESLFEFLSRGITTMVNSIKSWFSSVISSISGTIDHLKDFLHEINPIRIIQEKISNFIDTIFSIIPSASDIVDMVRSLAEKLYIPDWVLNKIVGKAENKTVSQPDIQTSNITKNQISALTTNSTANVINIVNNSNQNITQQSSQTSARRVSGVARTTARTTPSDKILYGLR